jgi:hypothetical protein
MRDVARATEQRLERDAHERERRRGVEEFARQTQQRRQQKADSIEALRGVASHPDRYFQLLRENTGLFDDMTVGSLMRLEDAVRAREGHKVQEFLVEHGIPGGHAAKLVAAIE